MASHLMRQHVGTSPLKFVRQDLGWVAGSPGRRGEKNDAKWISSTINGGKSMDFQGIFHGIY